MKIIGIADGSYTSKKDNQRKEGFRFYVTDDTRQEVTGVACDSLWVRAAVASGYLQQFSELSEVLGQEVIFMYNRFGQVEAIMPMPVSAPAAKK